MKVSLEYRGILAFIIALSPLLFNYYVLVEQILVSDLVILTGAVTAVMTGNLKFNRLFFYGIVILLVLIVLNQIRLIILTDENARLSGLLVPARVLFYYVVAGIVGSYFWGGREVESAVVTVALLSALYSIFQLIVYHTTGTQLLTGIPFLSQRFGLELFQNSSEIFGLYGYRPSSFFVEPAHLAQYCMVACLVLSGRSKPQADQERAPRLAWKISLLLVAPLLAGSGTAVISVLFMLALFMMPVDNQVPLIRKVMSRRLMMPALFLGIFAVALALDSSAISRVTLDSTEDLFFAESSALFVRVVRPFVYLASVMESHGLFQVLFGYGFGSYEATLQSYGLTTAYEDYSDVYWTNTFGLIVSAVGLVGFLAFVLVFISIWVANKRRRALTVYLFVSMFFSDMPASAYAFLVLVLVFSSAGRRSLGRNKVAGTPKSVATKWSDAVGVMRGSGR